MPFREVKGVLTFLQLDLEVATVSDLSSNEVDLPVASLEREDDGLVLNKNKF